MILGQKRLQISGADVLVASIASNKTARRVILCNRDSNTVAVTLFAVPVDQSGPPNIENEILGGIPILGNHTELLYDGEIVMEAQESIWAKGVSNSLDVVVTVMT